MIHNCMTVDIQNENYSGIVERLLTTHSMVKLTELQVKDTWQITVEHNTMDMLLASDRGL